VVALLRAPALLFVGLALAACGGKPGPEDPAVAVGTGIPVGAASAVGATFNPPAIAVADPPPRSAGGKLKELPKPMPADPFDPTDPTDPPAPSPLPPTKLPRKKGTSL
jgi:hypothetical protein